MKNRNYVMRVGALLGAVMGVFSLGATAGKLDTSKNLICATIDVVSCTRDNCLEVQAKDFDLPQFLLVDMTQKVIRATDDAGHDEASPFDDLKRSDGQIVFQGVEKGTGWTIVIDEARGGMTATVAGAEVSFIVFGSCTTI